MDDLRKFTEEANSLSESLASSNVFLLKRSIDLSLLRQGFHIPPEFHALVYAAIGRELHHGESCDVHLIVGRKDFKVRLYNIDFDRDKYPNHPDLLQVRYSENSDIAEHLQGLFSEAYLWLKTERKRVGPKKKIVLPKHLADVVVLWVSAIPGTFVLECLAAQEEMAVEAEIKAQDELSFEIFEPREDKKAGIKTSLRMQHVRQLDRSIGESLKRLYDYRCQVTGERIGEAYGNECIVEAHHIEYFTQSLNNDTANIIILSPTFHRIVHRYNPRFDRDGLCFEFENGVREAVRLDRHLKKA